MVLFANDGPLGQEVTKAIQPPSSFFGVWRDLNLIGNNAGSWSLSITSLAHWLLGPLLFCKFFCPLALFFLGLGAWYFFRQAKLSSLASALGALVITLNSTFFSEACWGVPTHEVALSMVFCALGLFLSCEEEASTWRRWVRLALAGLCVGINVIEAADIGALWSLMVAAFVLFKSLTGKSGSMPANLPSAVGRVVVIALFAALIATQSLSSLVSTQITGVAGVTKSSKSDPARWDYCTQWSLPKTETLTLFIPGLFGYRMDTPQNMMPALADAYLGGEYWGGVGRTPAIDRWLDNRRQGEMPPGIMRFSGGGNFCGILVFLLAGWTASQSFRKRASPFSGEQNKLIWFWTAILIVSLLLAWGRFAPLFYGILYHIPYFSTIRNPAKFLMFFSLAIAILFAYGVHALNQRYLVANETKSVGMMTQLQNWWARATSFDRRWTWSILILLGACLLGWLIYSSEQNSLVVYLQQMGFPDEATAKQIAVFSVSQVAWFVGLLAVAVVIVTLIIAGFFSGPRVRIGAVLLGAFLVFDLGRADLPYIIHWNYKQKYEVGSLNPIVDLLRNQPYEHRVAGLPFHAPEGFGLLDQLYRIEWMQHLFPYYNIQCLDIIQMPRMPEDLKTYLEALSPQGTAESVPLIAREWELTNTRYLLGPAGYLDVLNQQLDPGKQRFRVVQRFEILPKPGIDQPTQLEQLTAVPDKNGRYALFDFTGALPRARLYANWQVNTNDQEVLNTLANLSFDPHQTVLVDTPEKDLPDVATNKNSGTVEFKSYAPKQIVLAARTETPAVLLLNDKYDPNWRVSVDGRPAKLLRCNYIMRGVYLPSGQHTVIFDFSLPNKPLYVTLTAIGVGIILCGLLIYLSRKSKPMAQP